MLGLRFSHASIRTFLLVLTGAIIFLLPDLAHAQSTVKNVVTSVTTSTGKLPNLITTVAYISGIAFGVLGIIKLKEHVDSPPNVPLRGGLIRLLTGGMLLALPRVVEAMVNTIGNNGTFATFFTQLLGLNAANGPGVGAAAGGVGAMFANVINSFGTSANLLTSLAYISGLFLAVMAIFRFRDHVDKPGQVPLSDGVKRLIAGGLFLSLPMTVEAVTRTMAAGLVTQASVKGRHAWVVAATPASLDEVAVRLIGDIAGPISVLLAGFSFIGGLALILIGISRLTKTMNEGARGPAGIGTIMTFLSGGALMQLSNMVGAFSSSLFGDEKMSNYAVLSAPVNAALGVAAAGQVISTVEALMLFVSIVGYIAFIRGWFVLKAVADGSQGVSMAQGLTFLFGGSLAINLGDLINTIQSTLGYTNFGLAFQ